MKIAPKTCDWIDTPLPLPPYSLRALEAQAGAARKRAGLRAVGGRNALFLSECRGYARELASGGRSVSIDDVRRWAESRGIVPTHPNAWGAVFHGKGWTAISTERSTIPSAHARRIVRWTLID